MLNNPPVKDLIIFGASGFGREVAWLCDRINRVSPSFKLLGFLDDDDTLRGKKINGLSVLGKTADAPRYKDAFFVCAVGASKVREKIVSNLKAASDGIRFATLIDPSAEMSELVNIGEGSIICAHSILTVNISIGSHVIINLDCTVGHDAVIGDFSTLYPSANISGMTRIGHGCELGTGMQIIQGKSIGDGSVIGAGAVVIRDIPSGCTAVGNPAKPIKTVSS